jgi:putative ABC transport system substrate-binding protein
VRRGRPARTGRPRCIGASILDLHRRAAIYVNKILKGAKPSHLPVEQPPEFELFINRTTAKALDLRSSQTLLAIDVEIID